MAQPRVSCLQQVNDRSYYYIMGITRRATRERPLCPDCAVWAVVGQFPMRGARSSRLSSVNGRRPSECSDATAKARGQERRCRRARRPLRRDQAGASALQPQTPLAASAPRPACAIKSLPSQLERRSRKLLLHAKGSPEPCRNGPCPPQASWAYRRTRWQALRHAVVRATCGSLTLTKGVSVVPEGPVDEYVAPLTTHHGLRLKRQLKKHDED
jgi:hypothetical protein